MTRPNLAAPPSRGGSLAAALATRTRRSEPRAYDFKRPTKLSREHVRVLQIAKESFARQGTTVLTSLLRTGARLDLLSIEQFAYDDYVATLPNPTFIATFTLEPLPGKGLLALPLDSAMACIDHMLGGRGDGEQPSRPMTPMEGTIIQHLLDRLLVELVTSFSPVAVIDPQLTGLEYNPQLAQTSAGSDTVIVGRFTLSVGLRESEATLVLPFGSFDQALNAAARPQLSASDLRKREQAARALVDRINQVPVDVSVRCSPLLVSSEDLLGLAEGDVLMLRHPSNSPLEVTTNGSIFAHAMHGKHRRRLAARIVPTPAPDNDKDQS